jgi:hypothetical protein
LCEYGTRMSGAMWPVIRYFLPYVGRPSAMWC